MFTTTLKTIPEMPEKTEPTDQSPPRTGCDLGRCSHSWASDLERGDDSSSDRPGTGTDSGALLSSVDDYKGAGYDDDGKDDDAAVLTGRDCVAIAGAFCCLLSTMGVINAVGLLQRHMEQNQLRDYSPPQVGWIAAANSFLTLFSPLLAGPMYDRWGHSRIIAAGAGIFTAGIVVTSVLDGRTATADPAATYWLLFVFWGVFCGSGTGFVSTAVTGYTSGRFDKRRGLALGLGSAGGSMGGIVWPLVLRATLRAWGWMPAMLLVGGLAIFLLALGALCLCPAAVILVVGSRRRQHKRGRELEEGKRKEKKEEEEEEEGDDKRGRREISWASVWKVLSRVLSQVDFVLLTMSLVAFQFVVTGIMGTMPGWADRESFDRENIFYVVAAVNG
ncbi:hypothetical protein N3K66_005794 [Trichothecium roseum]|uniref:Uncharacterized protein n=1 Tax=Trichothecium roseum TaxID=47278 RepID=A0ACC0UYV2_9HYPO|nr:hypothetical protein N3K66_005794 [Trichothecium roseum]